MGYVSDLDVNVELLKKTRGPLVHLDFHMTPQ